MKSFVIFLLILPLHLQIADSVTKVRITPVRYENPTASVSQDGDCCDGSRLSDYTCTDACDTSIRICLDNTTGDATNMQLCTLGAYETTPLDNMDTFNFPNTTESMYFKMDIYQSNILIKIASYDMDTGAAVLIDNYKFNLSLIPPAWTVDMAMVQTVAINGTREPEFGLTRIILNISVFCENGWYGPACSVNCVASDDCFNHYSCDPVTGAKVCRAGWTTPELNCNVRNTSVDLLNCQRDDLCNHQGDCYSFGPNVTDFYCCCSPGFKGRDCSVLTTCDYNPCTNSGTCKQLFPLLAKCSCTLGYVGTVCETKLQPCLNNSCKNGATCIQNLADNSYTCQCPAGYNGTSCEFPHPCYSQPCFNGGGCVENGTNYTCACLRGYSGQRCMTDIDECSSSPCKNGGVCTQMTPPPATGPLFTCTCTGGFNGSSCELPHPCYSQPCFNGGRCMENGTNYTCACLRGYSGSSCENDTNECSSTPCQNGGACTQVVPPPAVGPLFTCSCKEGFNGSLCENPHPCYSQPCQYGGTCYEKDTNYTCTCSRGYTGHSCETDIDDCSPTPCQNGGTCTQLKPPPAFGPLFTCSCTQAFNGSLCEIPHPCVSQPCFNGGACYENAKSANYTCNCSRGYTGQRCENDTDECSLHPCQNNGTCTQVTPSTSGPLYICTCQLGYNGTNCTDEINWCIVNPCANNGLCTSKSPPIINRVFYNCACADGWTGSACETTSHPTTIELTAERSSTSQSSIDLYVIIGICIAAAVLVLSISAFIWHSVHRRRRTQRGVFDTEPKIFDPPPPLDEKPIATMTQPPLSAPTEPWF